jgi:hypothetical protein
MSLTLGHQARERKLCADLFKVVDEVEKVF